MTSPVPVTREGGAELDLHLDAIALAADLVARPSVSGTEGPLADAVEAALRARGHLQVDRDGDAVLARTFLGHGERVVIAGHLDTVPAANLADGSSNLAARVDGSRLYGLGACDMKGGVAVGLRLAATVTAPVRDVTYIFYDNEEVAAARNGLLRLVRNHPEWLAADFAVLMEPSNAGVEAGCQGTLRVDVSTRGVRAHSARSWKGVNAIHGAGEVLARLNAYSPCNPVIDGLTYREGLSAVGIRGGVAGNVIPDECVVSVNFRFAPDRSPEQALAHVHEVFDGLEIECTDLAPGALPGLDRPAAAAFLAATGKPAAPKFGWTDVARFSELGVPAVNFGPGDPSLAHTRDEYVETAQITECEAVLRAWLTGA
ncbi:MAG: succinyl-diaminopimelate desuccinylase [Sporichthyaceae bacterium]